MVVALENFCTLLTRSRLLSHEEVQALANRWRAGAKDEAEDGEQFAKSLVKEQLLTGYQAALLLRGHADQFFLDQYKLLERIGTGRMAGVFKAVHRLGQTVAIKVLPPSKAKVDELIGRFQREARISVRLRHPNIVRTFQMGETLGLHYLVMEYLEGETLEEVLKRRGRLPPPEAARIAYQALQGMQHIHEHGVVHRDLKPGNLMLVPLPAPGQDNTLEATIKVLDIGLGRAIFDENDPWGTEENFQLTTEGSVLGEPDYLAPEQAKDAHAADIRADIYSLGAILYHALAGHSPFPDTNRLRQMIRHATEALRPVRELNPAVSEALQAVIQRMLAKDPAQRPGTPQEAAQALEPFLPGSDARRAKPASSAVQSYLDYVDQEPAASAAKERKGPTAAAVHTWGSLFMKLPAEETASPVYRVAGEEQPQRAAPVIRAAPRPDLLPSVKEKANPSPKLQAEPPRAKPQPQLPPQPATPAASAPARISNNSSGPGRLESRSSRKGEGTPAARPRREPEEAGAEEEVRVVRPGRRTKESRKSRGDDVDERPTEQEVEGESSGMSRREMRLIVIGVAAGAGAILLAGALGLLIARSFQ
jgi:serine/threonine protein kinase